jgi:hypothetical protein
MFCRKVIIFFSLLIKRNAMICNWIKFLATVPLINFTQLLNCRQFLCEDKRRDFLCLRRSRGMMMMMLLIMMVIAQIGLRSEDSLCRDCWFDLNLLHTYVGTIPLSVVRLLRSVHFAIHSPSSFIGIYNVFWIIKEGYTRKNCASMYCDPLLSCMSWISLFIFTYFADFDKFFTYMEFLFYAYLLRVRIFQFNSF